jgi:nucleoside 2-deoxyribosyltransferase
MARIYLASPFGFTEAGRFFLQSKLIPVLQKTGNTIIDPWTISTDLAGKLQLAMSNSDLVQLKASLRSINNEICRRNETALRECDAIVAVLDGQEVDSGVAAEVGFAYALGKRIFGYRGDFRVSGDNIGAKVNLQVDGWVELSGGAIFVTVEELAKGVAEMHRRSPNRTLISQVVASK